MYEIGRAPESDKHPDHALARALAKGFWASLPQLEPALVARLLGRGRREDSERDIARLMAELETDAMRAALGRIACGYDGGQIVAED